MRCDAAEAASAAGAWVVGFVSYQAAPAFEPKLRVPAPLRVPELPLVWFGVYQAESEPLDFAGALNSGNGAPH